MGSMTPGMRLAGQTTMEDTILRGMRRARLSMHFNTPRVRRWLLVQLVTIPVVTEQDTQAVPPAPTDTRLHQPLSMQRLIDDFQQCQFLRRAG